MKKLKTKKKMKLKWNRNSKVIKIKINLKTRLTVHFGPFLHWKNLQSGLKFHKIWTKYLEHELWLNLSFQAFLNNSEQVYRKSPLGKFGKVWACLGKPRGTLVIMSNFIEFPLWFYYFIQNQIFEIFKFEKSSNLIDQ